MLPLAANFPDGSGYVLAAYLVFFALLLVYLGITAYRLLGLEKRLTDVTAQLEAAEHASKAPDTDAEPADQPKDGVAP